MLRARVWGPGMPRHIRDLAGVFPLLILPVVALLGAAWMPRWGFMWAMAFALYAGCKWLTYREARVRGVASDRLRALGYLLAWPGMDATAFLRGTDRLAQPRPSEWMAAALKTLLGATLIWVVARTAVPVNPLLAGWLGMVGLIFVLHFGTFHLLSLGWRSIGVNAMPVMQNPLRSTSLAEFWGRRWNTAFHELATRFTFRPLRPICRPRRCHAAGVSGLGLDSRAGDLDTRAGWLRAAHRIFRAPGTRSRRRAHATGAAARTRTWLARLAVHRPRRRRPGVLAVSSAVRPKRHPADARVHRRNLKGPYENQPDAPAANRRRSAPGLDVCGPAHAASGRDAGASRRVAAVHPSAVLGLLLLHRACASSASASSPSRLPTRSRRAAISRARCAPSSRCSGRCG